MKRALGAAYIPILLSEVEQEQRPSGNGDREAIVVGAGLRDGEGERAYTEYAPTLEGESTENLLPKRLSPAVKTFRQQKVAETSSAILLPKRLVPKRPEPLSQYF